MNNLQNMKTIQTFMLNFYKFQKTINITNLMCVQNSIYIHNYFKKLGIKMNMVNGIIKIKEENEMGYSVTKIEHTWINYDGIILEPNCDIYENSENVIGYFKNCKGCNITGIGFVPKQSLKQEEKDDKKFFKEHLIKFFSELKTQVLPDYSKCLIDRNEDFVNEELNNVIFVKKLEAMGVNIIRV